MVKSKLDKAATTDCELSIGRNWVVKIIYGGERTCAETALN